MHTRVVKDNSRLMCGAHRKCQLFKPTAFELVNIPPLNSSTELHCPGGDGGGDGRATGQRGGGGGVGISQLRQSFE